MVRIAEHTLFREVRPGIFFPSRRIAEPRSGVSRFLWKAKRFLIGAPIPTTREVHERLTKIKGLAVLSSDALSSVAYGTEAIMRALIVAGVGALYLTLPISMVIVFLLFIVSTSYQQTIRAYPQGGGSYRVARENLGVVPGLTAGASILIDYVLTVAVSVAAGIAAMVSAFPVLRPFSVELAVGAVVLVAVLNMRGIRESGTIFAAPTYVFIASIFVVIGIGLFQTVTGGIAYTPGNPGPRAGTEALGWFLILSAFARGCTAMTGTEAIADGVLAFKPPEPQNARITLRWMAFILGAMFLGISFLASTIGIVPSADESETVLSQLTRLVVGNSWFYYVVQFATALILFLAANTSYADFPRLLSIMARDRFVPRWFAARGDRLAFSFGIMTLTVVACILLIIFRSNVENLLPLYAIGVFTSFTLSQTGMVVHWLRIQEPGWRHSAIINGVGATMTAVVTLVIGVTKFEEGAWIVIILAGILIFLFISIHNHYLAVARQLRSTMKVVPKGRPPLVLVPIYSMSLVARMALAFAQDLSPRVVAVHVANSVEEAEKLRAEWREVVGDMRLDIIVSPYRLVIEPLLAYVDGVQARDPEGTVVIVLPEFIPKHWWENILHNQTALRLKAALLFHHGVAVLSFPFLLTE